MVAHLGRSRDAFLEQSGNSGDIGGNSLDDVGDSPQRHLFANRKVFPTIRGRQSCYIVEGGKELALNTSNDITRIFRRHVKSVYRLCYSYFGSAADAEDAVQATFMKLVANPRTFNDEQHERAWLLTCAANVCKDELKSARRQRAGDMPPDVVDERANAEGSDVLRAVLALPPQYKDCVYLHYYEGYKTDEIAEMTGTPPSTVRNHLSDARKMLRSALRETG